MPLTPSKAGQIIRDSYKSWLALDYSTSKYVEDLGKMEDKDFYDDFATAYCVYASDGKVVGAINNAMSLQGQLKSDLSKIKGYGFQNVIALAKAFTNFWSKCMITPAYQNLEHGGIAPVSMINNASSLFPLFVSAIVQTLTTTEYRDWYDNLISNVEKVVKCIVWTVTELFVCGTSTCPITFIEVLQ